MQLAIFTMGGTIDKVYFDDLSDYTVGEAQVRPILDGANVDMEYEILEVTRKDSLYVTDEERKALHDRIVADPRRHVLVTHGTDTMTETAKVLADIPDKVIVLTGAMAPARFAATDAVFNVGCAVGAVQCLPPGVYIAMNGRVFPAGTVRKNREKGRFEPLS
ncbi:asparaginase domain-containing protein [Solidesulfovibrio alcoholivorans]|uniref:asparaginase domain-containing protein n=1 Tax=Solidesulfovibrio alcoholivorans TaxID=81406 RepID=UPI000497981C|nr:asparaginase domain-containing protein [Solidesulfovibrio alcoholivorans]